MKGSAMLKPFLYVVAVATLLLGSAAAVTPVTAADLFVSPQGNDGAAGTTSAPFATIQHALEVAQPGDVVHLQKGEYKQDFKSVRDGQADKPIRVVGEAGAVINGGGEPRVIQINHDFHVLEGFTVDGKFAAEERKESYRDKLLYVIGRAPGRGVTGLKVLNMTFTNAGGECIRLRYQVTKSEIANSRIGRCGVHDFAFNDGGKNGEGIYIGSAPEQLGKNGAPDSQVDHSNDNWIHDNTFNTQGNECVDIKEGSSGNIVENNSCTGQKDEESAGFDSRGERNVFRNNVVFDNVGAGFRFGGDEDDQGIDNEAYGNTIKNSGNGAFALQRGPQGKICENKIENTEPLVRGSSKKGLADPRLPCSEFKWKATDSRTVPPATHRENELAFLPDGIMSPGFGRLCESNLAER
jgi:Protein of unknown function (DUF1565)